MSSDSRGNILEDGSIHYLNYKDLVFINRMLIERQTPKEPIAVINPSGLEASIERPALYRFYEQTEDMFRLAAVFIEGLIQTHCFANGNKRTAMQAGAMFLLLNGYELITICEDEFAHTAERLAKHEVDVEYLERWLYYHSKDFNTLELC